METTKGEQLADQTHSFLSSSVVNLYVGHFLARWSSRFIELSLFFALSRVYFTSYRMIMMFCSLILSVFNFGFFLGVLWGKCSKFLSWIVCMFVYIVWSQWFSFCMFFYIKKWFFSHCVWSPRCFGLFVTLINAKSLFYHELCFTNVELYWFKWVLCCYFPQYCTLSDDVVLGWNCRMLLTLTKVA